jgi:hypothetical protein
MRRFSVLLPEPTMASSELRMTARPAPRTPEPLSTVQPVERPASSVSYSVNRRGPVRISVVNILGQEVAVPLNAEQSEGTYSVDVGLAGLPSGIYFARIQTPGRMETKKVILTR